jgi:hypothetical protein
MLPVQRALKGVVGKHLTYRTTNHGQATLWQKQTRQKSKAEPKAD